MVSKLEEKALTAPEDENAALQKCISLFKSAKNDNERFASLLLVTRLVKSDNIDGAQRRLLFDAIGFTFINRLLNTRSVPEDCNSGVYQSLAIAILACFATDDGLILHPQMVAKIHLLNQMISNPSHEKAVVDDVYQILISFSSTFTGAEALLNKETMRFLCEVITTCNEVNTPDMAWTVLLNISTFIPKRVWIKHPKDLVNMLSFSTNKIKMLQDMNKFAMCKNVLGLLSNAETVAFREALKHLDTDQWLVDLCAGLRDILQGKVTETERDPALILVSVVTDLLGCGLKWTFCCDAGNQDDSAFFTFIVTLVSIEIRMILDDGNTEEVVKKSTLLTSCYNILENVISFLITMNDDHDGNHNRAAVNNKLDEVMISKLYSQVTEAMMSVLAFLQQGAVNYEAEEVSAQEKYLVIASARVLCAWLAEESMALQKEVNKVLPFLIRLAKDTVDSADQEASNSAVKKVSLQEPMETDGRPENHPVDMIQFMLPALCHFSAHDESRKILVENHMHHVLVKYYSALWKQCLEDSTTSDDTKTSLVTLLGVLLNFAVTEPKLVKEDQSFCEMQRHIMVTLPKICQNPESVILAAHMVVLGLMLSRHQKESNDFSNSEFQEFLKSSIYYLKEATRISLSTETSSPLRIACQGEWNSISELWFLGVQLLTACVEQFEGLDVLVRESQWLDNIESVTKGNVKQFQEADQNDYDALLGLNNVVMRK